ncbi:MAG TPA: chemotaxis protein CheW [Gemmatimonadaceae bacterium]|jgi:purine-binding chemotaxis protein CheW
MNDMAGISDELDIGADENQFLTLVLNGEEYGLRILKVQEIKGFTSITPIPGTPAYIKGAMNLRGTVVPVVDLRAKFAMPAAQYDQFTVIVVVDVGSRIVGLVVDAVSDVLNFAEADIAPPPTLGNVIDTSFLTGLAKSGDKLVLLLDIDAVIGADIS